MKVVIDYRYDSTWFPLVYWASSGTQEACSSISYAEAKARLVEKLRVADWAENPPLSEEVEI